jgi:tRNA (adenine22-N1)-methyltransferase
VNKLTKRLESLISFFEKKDSLVDIGCDHAYLSIYLKKNNIVKDVICSDISKSALSGAIANIKNEEVDIKAYVSDGINDIPLDNINTILISGMGTRTITHILNDKNKLKKIKKIVIQTNNNYEEMRRFMNDSGYYLKEEKEIFDKDIWYIDMLFIKSSKKNSEEELKYGYLNNKDYQNYLINYYDKIIFQIPKRNKDYERYNKIRQELEVVIKK